MALKTRALALAGILAGTTIFVSPASAAELAGAPINLGSSASVFDQSRFDPAAEIADWRRCRWNCGWGGGWGRHRGWRRNRVDAGDVLIGAAIIGGIAAIASSNNRRQRERDVVIVERDQRDWDQRDDRRYDDRRIDDRRIDGRSGIRGAGASGLDNAVDMCLSRIERDVRVDSVDNVDRTGAGWVVSGSLFNGSGFQCRIGNGGQIDGIDYGGGLSDIGFTGGLDTGVQPAAGQWSDQRYADARLALGQMAPAQSVTLPSVQPRLAQTAAQMPAYPGGPIPGEEIPETIDGGS